VKEVGGPAYPPAVNAVQAKAKAAGYWAFHLPKEAGGAGIPFMYYVRVNEILGRSRDTAASVCQGGRMKPADAPGGRCRQPIVAGATPDERDPATWPPEALTAIQAVIDRSRRGAGQAVRDTFDRAERRMTALEFVQFWNGTRMKAMATTGPDGTPHLAPVHAEFVNGRLHSTIYENAVRRRDLRDNPRVALTTWGPHGAAAIVHGRARELPDSLRTTRPGATGTTRRTVALDIEVTRIYAMKARAPETGD